MSLRFDRFCLNYTFSSFSRFLLKLGWKQANNLNDYYNVWHSPIIDGNQEELVVPITNEVFRLERDLNNIIKSVRCNRMLQLHHAGCIFCADIISLIVDFGYKLKAFNVHFL